MADLLRVEDYVIIGLILVISTAIGMYHSLFKSKNSSSTSEYFLASKNMQMVPIALSYFATIVATGTLLGLPTEAYFYGFQPVLFVICFPLIIVIANYIFLPVFYVMKTASILKYIEIRFNRSLANVVVIANIVQMILHSSVSLYGASIAIAQVTALSWKLTSAVLAGICIVYSTMGGLRGIIIADAFQALVMIAGLILLLAIGLIESGGINNVIQLNSETDRLNIFNFSTSLVERNTFWSCLIGYGTTGLIILSISQSNVQRLLAAPSITKAIHANIMGTVINISFFILSMSTGLIAFAYFKKCNILKANLIANANQVVPSFAINIFSNYTCAAGLFFGALLSSSLSTISSSLNSISAVFIESFQSLFPNFLKKHTTNVCKLIVLIAGILAFSGIFIIDKFPNLAQASLSLLSAFATPIFALLILGIFCPQAKTNVAILTFVLSLACSLWLILGNIFIKSVHLPKPFFNENCPTISMPSHINSSIHMYNGTFTSLIAPNITSHHLVELNRTSSTVSTTILPYIFPLSGVAFYWYSLFTLFSFIIIFIVLSVIFGGKREIESQNKEYLVLIPSTVRSLHFKFSKRVRKILLCDVYD